MSDNVKYVLIGAVVLVVGFFAYRYFTADDLPTKDVVNDVVVKPKDTVVEKDDKELSALEKLLISATLTVPETNVIVTITNDGGKIADYQDGEEKGLVTIPGFVKSINDDEFIAIVAVNRGGSSEEMYLAGFQPGEASNQMSASEFLGDRVLIKDITVTGNTVTVSYMAYGPDQAMADVPNVKVTKTYTYDAGNLVESVQ